MKEVTLESDALSLEYKRDYGTASGDAEISDFVNNPFINSPFSILRLLGQKEFSDLSFAQVSIIGDDSSDFGLVG